MDTPLISLGPSWQEALKEELKKPYLINLLAFVEKERKNEIIFPPRELVFNAFFKTPYEKVRVVIMGQDPYHGEGQAHGLSFSVPKGTPLPPSLKNIYLELEKDLGIAKPSHGCLIEWANQGVFLLNATLTVRKGQPNSHHGKGWELFTDSVVKALSLKKEPLVFILWGKSAQDKFSKVSFHSDYHLVIKSPHPSPFSAHSGFFGSRPFSKANDFLISKGLLPIQWDFLS